MSLIWWTNLIIAFAVIIISIVLHELAHGLMAFALGDETARVEGRLSINPIVHLDWANSVFIPLCLYLIGAPVIGGAKPVPVDGSRLKWNEYGMALVALAGPAMNFVLAIISAVIFVYGGFFAMNGSFMQVFLQQMIIINIGLMVFNLIPIPPLDGSRILYAIAPDGVREILAKLENVGIVLVFTMVFLFSASSTGFIGAGAIRAVVDFIFWLVTLGGLLG